VHRPLAIDHNYESAAKTIGVCRAVNYDASLKRYQQALCVPCGAVFVSRAPIFRILVVRASAPQALILFTFYLPPSGNTCRVRAGAPRDFPRLSFRDNRSNLGLSSLSVESHRRLTPRPACLPRSRVGRCTRARMNGSRVIKLTRARV